MQLQVQTLLNHVHPFKSFVYADVRLVSCEGARAGRIEARIMPRKGSRARCCRCKRLGPTYDHQPERRFDFVPVWSLLVFLLYAPRRVDCRECGVHVEEMPWAMGKSSMTTVYMSFPRQLGPSPVVDRDGTRVRQHLGQRLPGCRVGRRVRARTSRSQRNRRDRRR